MPIDASLSRICSQCLCLVKGMAIIIVLLFPLPAAAEQGNIDRAKQDKVIKIGVLAHRGSAVAFKTWFPLSTYLNKKLPDYRFQIIPLNLAETRERVAQQSVDFLLTNPGNYIDLENRFNLRALATLKKKYRNHHLNEFGAVIFTRATEKKINSLADLKSKSFMGVKPGAFGGFQLAWGEFKNHHIDPFSELSELQFSGFPQSAVVVAVSKGLVDAGTVRTGILESMAEQGLIKLKDFKILNAQHKSNFPHRLSTGLYPEWPLAHLANTDQKLIKAVYQALLKMPKNIIKSGRTQITGWRSPSDYRNVHDLMRQLQVGAYKNVLTISPSLFLKNYLVWIMLAVATLVILILFMLHTLFLNRRIMLGKRDLEREVREGLELKQSLQGERNFLRTLLDNISDGVLACDKEGRITLYNRAMLSICSLNDKSIVGSHWRDLFDFYQGDSLTPLADEKSPFARILSGQSVNVQGLVIKTKKGMRHLLVSGQSLSKDSDQEMGAVFTLHDETVRIANDRRLRDSEKELRAILDSMQDTYYRTDLDGKVVRTSRSVYNMLGYTTEESLGVDMRTLYVVPGGRDKFLKTLEESNGEIQNYQMPMWHKDGHAIWVSTSAHFHYDSNGNVDGVEGVTRDITELKNAEAQIFKEKERAHITLQSIGDGVITMDVSGNIEYLNPYAEQMVGCSSDSAANMPLASLLSFTDAAKHVPLDDPVSMCLEEEQVVVFNEHVHAVRKDGARFAVKLTVSPMRDLQGRIQGVVMVLHDASEMWKMAQQLSYQASHDALTGLINRREFDQQLAQALERCRKTGRQHTLCYMDLDQFKIVNDTCGHIAGDRLLKQLSQVLVSDVRDNDVFARLGGDEFGLLLEGCSLGKAESIVEKVRKKVKGFRFTWEDKNFEIGVSIGMVPIDKDSVSVTELLSEADAACYVAKDLGRNRIHKYQQGDSELVKHKSEMQWVNRIQQALEEDRLVCYCQSIQPLECDLELYAEILIRMLDENGDIVLPGAFIPAAERYHLMSDIDRWVIRNVFAWLQKMEVGVEQHYTINLSGQSVGDNKILQFIIDNLNEFEIDPSCICFEITETAAVANLDSARDFIAHLHELGCKFALDDFGSGLSSFAYLKNLDVDYLKIDGSFVQDINNDPVDYAMVASINRIGHLMGIKTIAEFVEDSEILERLKEIGVDYVQGYNIDIPKPLSDLSAGKIARV